VADRLIKAGTPAPPPLLPAFDARGLRVAGLARSGGLAAAAGFAAVAAAIIAVHLPALQSYFFGDDFVALSDVSSRSTWAYLRDVFLLRDLTPNWRFLTGVYYLVAYRTFGLDAFPYLLSSVLVHTATAGLIFWLVRRALAMTGPAVLAAALFGLSAAHVPTVGQVTAFNNVLAGFLLTLSIVLMYEGALREQPRWCWFGSAAAFGGAIAANESAAVLAPVVLFVAWWGTAQERRPWRTGATRVAMLASPHLVLGAAAIATFTSCQCTEAANQISYGWHIEGNVWIYLGRLLYPVGLEAPGEPGSAHFAAGIVVAVIAAIALVQGPGLARLAAAFLALALVPYVPLELWSASRYVYLAAIPFSILAALFFLQTARLLARVTPAFALAIAAVAIGVVGLYSWQTWEQEQAQAALSEDWRTLVSGLDETYPELPEESTVYVYGSDDFNALFQCAVLPAVGEVLWGEAKVFTFLSGDLNQYRIRPGYRGYVVAERGDTFRPVAIPVATEAETHDASITLLPHVPPAAHGNLCLPGALRFP
jgi:hypothetical protein